MRQHLQLLILALAASVTSCQPLTTSPTPSFPTLAITSPPTASPRTVVVSASAVAPTTTVIADVTLRPPCSATTPDIDAQFVVISKQWPVPTWLPERMKLCRIYQDQEDSGEVVILVFEGEGRNYNAVTLRLRHHTPPQRPAIEVESDSVRLENGIEAHRFYVRYGGTLLSWSLGDYWVQLEYLGDALDPEEAIKIAENVIAPP